MQTTNNLQRVWIVSAYAAFLLSAVVQIGFKGHIWLIHLISGLPGIPGDVVTMILWFGAGPFILGYLFLLPIRPIRRSALIGFVLTVFGGVLMPLADRIFHIQTGNQLPMPRTDLIYGISLIGIGIVLYSLLVLIPQVVVIFINKEK